MGLRENQEVITVGRIVAGVIVSVAAVALSVGVLFLAIENRNLRESQDCRFDISAEVNAISDRIDQATARGLVALAEANDPELANQVAIIREQTALLEPAIEQRTRAVEVCN